MFDANLIPAIVISFAVTTTFMFALRPVAKSVGLVDRPGGRKSHIGEVPIIGGIAMYLGLIFGLHVLQSVGEAASTLAVAAGLLVVIGVTDDKYAIPPSVRFAAQIAAVLIMAYGGNLVLGEIGDPFGTGLITMGPFTLIFTMTVALTMINAYNLIDGADGLAGTLAVICLLSLAIAGGGSPSSAIALAACAAIVGYLLFNFPFHWNRPLRSFMGDAGSTMIGFTIVWVALGISQGPDRMLSPVHCLWFASIPIYDCLTCFVRRIARNKSPFTPGRDHFHHTLKRGGMGFQRSLAMLAGLQAFYAIIGLVGHFAHVPDSAMFAMWAVLGLTQRFFIKLVATHHRSFVRRRRHARVP